MIVLPCGKTDGFPLPPNTEKSAARLLTSALRGALAKTLFCVSTEQSRYTLNALRLEIHTSVFRLVATDGHRLSVVEGAAPVEATIIFRRQDWLEGLEKLRPVAMKQHNHPVAFDFSNGRAIIKAEADGTQAQAELAHTRISGRPRRISFNHAYLMQYAKSLEAENVSMRLFQASMCEAVLFDSFRYRHVLMPLRT